MSFLHRLIGRDLETSNRRHPRAFRPGTRPIVEDLEDRLVLSAAAVVAPLVQPQINILPQLSVTNVVQGVGGALNAVVALGNQTVNVPLTLTSSPNLADPTCPILNLHLGEIHLNLLGLNVDTSEICLSITAHENGGLLGDLLCGVSNLLQGGTPLGTILGGLNNVAGDLNTVLSGLTGLLNGALGAATTTSAAPTTGQATPTVLDSSPGACDILNLSLGPIDLTLLGLNVHLDNCHGGPVTVDITAQPGGGLLGDLLCSLDNLLTNGQASTRAVDRLLTNIARDISRLV